VPTAAIVSAAGGMTDMLVSIINTSLATKHETLVVGWLVGWPCAQVVVGVVGSCKSDGLVSMQHLPNP